MKLFRPYQYYQQHIFPHLLDQVMKTASLMDARRELLLPISDECLEIGFGTGLNLAFYQNLNVLYALEPNAHIEALSSDRLAQSNFEIRHLRNFAESIPLPTNSVKNVVSTWTMCSVPKLEQALAEIYRVMQVGGTFHLVEHVYSDQTSTQRWQNALTPIQKKLADGCHLNRNIEYHLINAGFEFVEKRYFHADGIPSIGNRMLLARVQKR